MFETFEIERAPLGIASRSGAVWRVCFIVFVRIATALTRTATALRIGAGEPRFAISTILTGCVGFADVVLEPFGFGSVGWPYAAIVIFAVTTDSKAPSLDGGEA